MSAPACLPVCNPFIGIAADVPIIIVDPIADPNNAAAVNAAILK
jgi:hypothetical protein